MRAIPAELVQTAYAVTHVMKSVHGAPIHIGNPGIKNKGGVNYYLISEIKSLLLLISSKQWYIV